MSIAVIKSQHLFQLFAATLTLWNILYALARHRSRLDVRCHHIVSGRSLRNTLPCSFTRFQPLLLGSPVSGFRIVLLPLVGMIGLLVFTGRYRLMLDPETYEPRYLLTGVVLGSGAFFLSIAINNLSITKAIRIFSRVTLLFSFCSRVKKVLFTIVWLAFFEEVIWRGVGIFLLGGSGAAAALVSLWFASVHLAKRERIVMVEWIDFLLFSFLLSFSFFVTQNLILVVEIHAIRNILIAFYKVVATRATK